MPKSVGVCTVEIQAGPALRAALDVLDCAREASELIPGYAPERAELLSRMEMMQVLCTKLLKASCG